MKIKSTELTGTELIWAVATAKGHTLFKDALLGGENKSGWWVLQSPSDPNSWVPLSSLEYHRSWVLAGPIIDEAKISLFHQTNGYSGAIRHNMTSVPQPSIYYARTTMVAAMRCFVGTELGDIVDVPDELVELQVG